MKYSIHVSKRVVAVCVTAVAIIVAAALLWSGPSRGSGTDATCAASRQEIRRVEHKLHRR